MNERGGQPRVAVLSPEGQLREALVDVAGSRRPSVDIQAEDDMLTPIYREAEAALALTQCCQ